MKRLILFIALLLLLIMGSMHAYASEQILYLFWTKGCPHCKAARSFLKKLESRFPQIKVEMYEVSGDEANEKLFRDILGLYGLTRQIFPTIFIGDLDPVVGYYNDSTTGAEIEEKVVYCLKNQCRDPISDFLSKSDSSEKASGVDVTELTDEMVGAPKNPLINKFDSSRLALPLFTVVIALLDSINPCAFFVLIFLLSLLTHLSSSKKMLLTGGTFVFFSAVMYFLFMSAWLNLFYFTRTVRLITTIAGIVAVCMALVNIKDFLFFKIGFSLSIPEVKRQVLFNRMRALVALDKVPAMVAGSAVLAIGANFYELLCTTGFPMVYTKVLTLRKMRMAEYYFYLTMYNIIYVLPLLVIVVGFALTLGSRKMTEWQGRILKLASGIMMLSLGIVLIVNPSLLNKILYSITIVAGALAFTLFIAFFQKSRIKNSREVLSSLSRGK